jgi:hypothetical protein
LDALGFGGAICNTEDGRKVILKCYSMEEAFQRETAIVRDHQLDPTHVEEILTFAANDNDRENFEGGASQQYCISIERPSLTLDRLVAGMLKNDGYKHNADLSLRSPPYGRQVSQVHGDPCMGNCGKFDETWKIAWFAAYW